MKKALCILLIFILLLTSCNGAEQGNDPIEESSLDSSSAPKEEETPKMTEDEGEDTEKAPESSEIQSEPEESAEIPEVKLPEFDFEEISSYLLAYEGDIAIMKYTQGHWSRYVSKKNIKNEKDDAVKRIAKGLSELKPTGEIEDKLADGTVEVGQIELPIEYNTRWIQIGDLLYRISANEKQICIVETHLGPGLVLEYDEDFMKYLTSAYNYWPLNGSQIIYDRRDLNVDENGYLIPIMSYASETKADVYILGESFNFDVPQFEHYTVIFKVVAREDINDRIKLHSYQSEDNEGTAEAHSVNLKKGESVLIKGSFSGWPQGGFWLEFEISNTFVEVFFAWGGVK